MKASYIENFELNKLIANEYNQNIQDEIKYFIPIYMDSHIHFISMDNQKIVGILALQKNLSSDGESLHLEYISVNSNYRNQGIATDLITMAIEYCAKNSFNLKVGNYSDDGVSYIRQVLSDLTNKYGIKLINS